MQLISIFLKKSLFFIGRLTFLLVCLQVPSYTIVAQSLCSQNLESAKLSYKLGQFEKVIAKLQTCLDGVEDGFDNLEDKADAYRLVILAYIFSDELAPAHKNIKRLLKEYPSFKIYDADTPELKYLFQSYRNLPLFSIYASAQPSYILPNALQNFQISTLSNREKLSYKNTIVPISFSVGFYYYIWRSFFIHSGVNYQVTNISQTAKISFSQLENYGTEQPSLITSEHDETQRNLEIPISLHWIPSTYNRQGNLRKMIPYVGVGIIVKNLLTSELAFERTQDVGNISIENIVDIKELRRSINYDAFGQLGMQFKVGLRSSFSISAGYRLGLFNQSTGNNYFASNAKNRQNTNDLSSLTYDAAYTNNKFSVNQLLVSVQLHYLFYKPKRKKK